MKHTDIAVIETTSRQIQTLDFNQEKVEMIKRTIAKDATDAELQMFIEQCKRTQLDPITRQIYFLKNNGRVQVQTSVDGFRLIAERSGLYEGQTKAEWCGEDGKWTDIWLKKTPPSASRIGVYKRGFREALYATAVFDEYVNPNSPIWKKMPALMIAKVAESLALRKAFPNDLSGLYTQEEMDQAGKSEPKQYKTHTSSTPRGQAGVSTPSLGSVSVSQPVDATVSGSESVSVSGSTYSEPTNGSGPGESSDGEQYTVTFGQYKGKALNEINLEALKKYLVYITNKVDEAYNSGKPVQDYMTDFLLNANAYIAKQS